MKELRRRAEQEQLLQSEQQEEQPSEQQLQEDLRQKAEQEQLLQSEQQEEPLEEQQNLEEQNVEEQKLEEQNLEEQPSEQQLKEDQQSIAEQELDMFLQQQQHIALMAQQDELCKLEGDLVEPEMLEDVVELIPQFAKEEGEKTSGRLHVRKREDDRWSVTHMGSWVEIWKFSRVRSANHVFIQF